MTLDTHKYNLQSPASRVMVSGYDDADDMLRVKSVQKKFRDSFPGTALNAQYWTSQTGTGGAISVAGGALTMGSGTTINSESWVMSNEFFTVPFRVSIGLTLSQRIADQSFYVELVSIDPVTQQPNGLHKAGWLFDGTSATTGKYVVQNSGITELVSGGSTVPTTASGSYFELEPFSDECWFHGGGLDSTSARSNSYRRHQQIPDPNALYKLRLRWKNGAIAPASNTNAVIQFVAIQDYAELTAEITAGRGQAVAGQALGVQVTGGGVQITGGTSALSNAINSPVGVTPKGGNFANLSSTALAAGATYSSSVLNAFSATYTQMENTHIRVSVVHAAGATGFGKLFIETYDTASTTPPTSGQRITYSVPVPSDGLVHTFLFPVPTKYFRVNFKNEGSITQTTFNLSLAYLTGSDHQDVETNVPVLLSTTALAASASFTSVAMDFATSRDFTKLALYAWADQAGTMRVEQSWDSATWRKTHELTVTASTPALITNADILMRYVRLVFANGATLQGAFTFACNLTK